MKRRDFLKFSSAFSLSSPIVLNQTLLQAFSPLGLLSDCKGISDRVIVIIQLDGGNDGLNTLVPINQYDDYVNHRPNIAIPQSSYINLDDTLPDEAKVGLHPVMNDFKTLYDTSKVHIIRGVGYPSMNLSHFKSTDLWMT